MAIKPVITFVGTGSPVSPNTNVFVNREPSSKGVVYSGVRSKGEFNELQVSKAKPDLKTLGKKAVSLQKSLGISVNVTI